MTEAMDVDNAYQLSATLPMHEDKENDIRSVDSMQAGARARRVRAQSRAAFALVVRTRIVHLLPATLSPLLCPSVCLPLLRRP